MVAVKVARDLVGARFLAGTRGDRKRMGRDERNNDRGKRLN
jgi:hypothetical protein